MKREEDLDPSDINVSRERDGKGRKRDWKGKGKSGVGLNMICRLVLTKLEAVRRTGQWDEELMG